MTRHLSPEDLVTALDGTLSREQQGHLHACDACRSSLADLQGALSAARGDAVPEPSPLFWDHLSARIQSATAGNPVPGQVAWWQQGWRPFVALGSMAAAAGLTIAIAMPGRHVEPDVRTASTDVARDTTVAANHVDAGSWQAMTELAASLSDDEVHLVVAAAPEFAPTVGELTPQEREAFVKLLGSEMNGDLK
jgi:hypothetical protein